MKQLKSVPVKMKAFLLALILFDSCSPEALFFPKPASHKPLIAH